MNKPIKRNPHLAALSRDHHQGLLFCWKLRMGIRYEVNPERMLAYVRYFWPLHFKPHFAEEEEFIFFPHPSEMTKRAIEEHETMRQQIGQIEAGATYDTFNKIADLADKHIRFEERELFPYLEETLTEAQLLAIGQAVEAAPVCGADEFADEFWTKPKTNA